MSGSRNWRRCSQPARHAVINRFSDTTEQLHGLPSVARRYAVVCTTFPGLGHCGSTNRYQVRRINQTLDGESVKMGMPGDLPTN